MNDFFDYEFDILDEAYVGETKFIKDLIELIGEARAPYVGKIKRPIKGNKDFLKIGEMLAKEFGFYAVDFSVPFDVSMNAFTYPITMSLDRSVIGIKPKFIKDKGYKYDEINRLCIIVAVTAGVWFNKNISDREVAAAILHEIGHSFVLQSDRMIDLIEINRLALAYSLAYQIILDMLYAPYNVPNDIKTYVNLSNSGKEIKLKLSKLLADDPFFAGIAFATEWVTGVFTQFINEIFSLFSPLINVISIPFAALNKLLSALIDNTALDRSQEYLSDSFATSYGLGPEISSFLVKIETSAKASGSKTDYILTKIPIVGAIRESFKIPVLLLNHGITVHPSTPARINKILAELNKELNNSDLSPKTKEAVRQNIKSLEAIKDECINMPKKNHHYDGEAIKQMWMSFTTNKPEKVTDFENYYTDLENRDKYMGVSKESTDILDNIKLI